MASNTAHSIKRASLGIRRRHDLILQKGQPLEKLRPGEVIGPLIRDFLVVKYCICGKGVITVNDIDFPIKGGQCFVALPGDIMIETADQEDPWQQTWLVFDGIRASMMFKTLGVTSQNPLLPWSSNPQILQVIQDIIPQCENPTRETELRRISLAYAFLDELLGTLRENRMLSEPPDNLEETYVSEAIYYMELNYSNKLKIADVAAYIGLNRSYFYTIFKAHTSLSPQQYLTKLRIDKACELFAYPYSTVGSVANSLGYDASAFSRHFKEIIGISPSEYKEYMITKESQSKENSNVLFPPAK